MKVALVYRPACDPAAGVTSCAAFSRCPVELGEDDDVIEVVRSGRLLRERRTVILGIDASTLYRKRKKYGA